MPVKNSTLFGRLEDQVDQLDLAVLGTDNNLLHQLLTLCLFLDTIVSHGDGYHLVILCTGGIEPDEQSLLEAASLAAYFSQAQDSTKVPVDYTPVKFVKKPAGARPGMVVYTTYNTLLADPDAALVKKLSVK